MKTKVMVEDFKNLLETVSEVDEMANDIFKNPSARTKQMVDIFGYDFVKKAENIFSESELDSVQNIIDVFYNLTLKH